jgi:hypothetical protein
MKTNSSGYTGVRWHKAAKKWAARITVDGVDRHLGLFPTAEEANNSYVRAVAELRPEKTPDEIKAALLKAVRHIYEDQGISALDSRALVKQKGKLSHHLRKIGITHSILLEELGLKEEYIDWRTAKRIYRGIPTGRWTWKKIVATAKDIKEREGYLPTKDWFHLNGHSSLGAAVYKLGHTWEELRSATGCFTTSHFRESRNGMRWRSRPEASLSNFLYARGIEHKRGERYDSGYSEQSGRHYGVLDMHFISSTGAWIDVEVWGDELNALSGGRYQATRRYKEKWQAKNPNFLGIHYKDCLSDAKLTENLGPYIGFIEPFQFDKPVDREILTSHWSDADELLVACGEFAARMPDGIFPGESWLRRRGKYKDRPGPTYNVLALRANQWIGGIRKLRQILGHGHASTTSWTPEKAIEAWREFHQQHGLTPSQCLGAARQKLLPPEVVTEAGRIYQATRTLGVLSEARNGKTARESKWTPETTITAWQEFTLKHGRSPSQCMSSGQRRRLPRAVTDEATRIYEAARKCGVLAIARGEEQKVDASSGDAQRRLTFED